MNSETPAPFENTKAYVQLILFVGITFLSVCVLFLVLGILQYAGAINLISIDNPDAYSDPSVMRLVKVVQVFSDLAMFILPSFIIALLASKKRMKFLGIDRTAKISIFLLAGILMICATPLINYMAELNSYLTLPSWLSGLENWMKETETTQDAMEAAFLSHQSVKDLIENLFMIAFVAGFAEELFFRGVMQKLFTKMTKNVHWGIWITAIIFSAIHVQFYGFFPRMFLGAFLGYLFVWTRSLWVNIFAHTMFNATTVIFAFLEERKRLPDTIDKIGSQGSDYLYILGSTAIVAVLMVVIYKMSKLEIDELPVLENPEK